MLRHPDVHQRQALASPAAVVSYPVSLPKPHSPLQVISILPPECLTRLLFLHCYPQNQVFVWVLWELSDLSPAKQLCVTPSISEQFLQFHNSLPLLLLVSLSEVLESSFVDISLLFKSQFLFFLFYDNLEGGYKGQGGCNYPGAQGQLQF